MIYSFDGGTKDTYEKMSQVDLERIILMTFTKIF